ncbi:MAG: hypothetical protein REI94_19305, partial [Moraxellaceae bacterium]|nr:hypothetical protein [Moraxellaceae bacterium]
MKNSLLLTLLCAGISIAHAGGSTKGTGGFNTSSLNGATPGNEQSADAPATATTHRYSAIVL